MGLPTVTWIMLGAFVVFWFASKYTVTGTNFYAVGGNPKAARNIGINVDRVKILALIGTSLFNLSRAALILAAAFAAV